MVSEGSAPNRFTISLPEDMVQWVEGEAATHRIPVSQVLRHLIRNNMAAGLPAGPQATPGSTTVSSLVAEDDETTEGQGLRRLPFGSEFTAETVVLPEVLEIVKRHEGDKDGIATELKARFFSRQAVSGQNTLATNCRLSLKSYGVIGDDWRLTDLGQEMYAHRAGPELLDIFARHILVSLGGLQLIQAIRDLEAGVEKPSLETIRPALEQRGVYMPRGSKHVSSMRSWLRAAGVLDKGWGISDSRLQALLGMNLTAFDAIAERTPQEMAFLKALCQVSAQPGPYSASEVAKLAQEIAGVRMPEKDLPNKVLYPLEKAGLIAHRKTTGGRGARSHEIWTTAQFNAEVVAPFLEQVEQVVGRELLPFLRMPFKQVLVALQAPTTHERGLALEALAVKIMNFLGCVHLGTRVRGTDTGGAEVDALFETHGVAYVRWQVQAKNKLQVAVEDIAKEIGVAQTLKAQAVVMITTGAIGEQARRFALTAQVNTMASVYLIDGDDIRALAEAPERISEIFRRETERNVVAKRLQR